LAIGGFGFQFLGEACRAEEAECSVGSVVPGRREEFTKVLEPAKLG
jgi:hypothetical protein